MRRYTTILLNTSRLSDSRDRVVLAIVTAMIALAAIGSTVAHWRAAAQPKVEPRIAAPAGFIIITATPAATWTPAPTPQPVVIFQTVEVPVYAVQSAPREAPAAPAVEQQPEAAPAAPQAPEPTYSAFYTDIPTAPPDFVAACQTEAARSSWVCGGQP